MRFVTVCHDAPQAQKPTVTQRVNNVNEGTFGFSPTARHGRRHGQTVRLEARTQGRRSHQPHAQRRRGPPSSHIWLLWGSHKNRPPNLCKMCAHPAILFCRALFLKQLAFSNLSSWSKQRKSCSGICRRILCQHRLLAHERRAARRRHAKSRAIRHARFPPNALPLPPSPAATAAERARPRPRSSFSFAPSFALAAAALPAQGAGLQRPLLQCHRRLVPPPTAHAAPAQAAPATAGRLSPALPYAFSVPDPPAWWCAGYEEEVPQLRAWWVRP